MPHEVGTESNGLGVVVSFSGVVSGPEVLDLNARLISEESYSRCRYQVWDFSKASRLDLTIDDLRSISVQDITASAINPDVRIAIVGEPAFFANRDQIFQIFEEVWTSYRPKFFTDSEIAREWAASDRP
jgi:hypothetical protein